METENTPLPSGFEKKPGPFAVSTKWGLIGGVVTCIISYLVTLTVDYSSFEAMEKSSNFWMSTLTYAAVIVAFTMAQLEHRNKELNGEMSYGRAVGVASLTSLFSGILVGTFTYIQFSILMPEVIPMIREASIAKMAEMPAEQEEQAIKGINIFVSPGFFAIMTVIGTAFWGIICGLISSIFTQKTGAKLP